MHCKFQQFPNSGNENASAVRSGLIIKYIMTGIQLPRMSRIIMMCSVTDLERMIIDVWVTLLAFSIALCRTHAHWWKLAGMKIWIIYRLRTWRNASLGPIPSILVPSESKVSSLCVYTVHVRIMARQRPIIESYFYGQPVREWSTPPPLSKLDGETGIGEKFSLGFVRSPVCIIQVVLWRLYLNHVWWACTVSFGPYMCLLKGLSLCLILLNFYFCTQWASWKAWPWTVKT